MSLKKATAAESKTIKQRWVWSNGFLGCVQLGFHDRKDPFKGTGYSWGYQEERLQDLLDTLDEIEDEWRNQKDLTDKEDIPIENPTIRCAPSTSGKNKGFISCEDGCVILKWVNDGKARIYERFDNPKNFSKFRKKLHASLKCARYEAESFLKVRTS